MERQMKKGGLPQSEWCRRSERRRRRMRAELTAVLFALLLVLLPVFGIISLICALRIPETDRLADPQRREMIRRNHSAEPDILEDMLTLNPYSRPGEKLSGVENIFIHYTANPGTSAKQNRSYFDILAVTGERSASAHFIIGTDGEIIQCVPLNEIAYAVKTRNYDSISIECCYLQADGQFTDATYQSLVRLTGWLLKEYRLVPEDVLRHYDAGGKKCPLYFVDYEDSWYRFREDLTEYICL